MADAVLCFGTHLGKGEAACFSGSKDWVVSEATFAGTLRQYLAFHDAFEESFLSILNEGYDCAEASLACLCLFNLVEQASNVGIGIMAFAISVHGTETSRIDSWRSAECIYPVKALPSICRISSSLWALLVAMMMDPLTPFMGNSLLPSSPVIS